jgi:lipoyl-dependent peroxiredoxin
MERKATARWQGDLRGGAGTFRTESDLVVGTYSAGTRFASEPGTNPEELIAAAHASCFSMAFANGLATGGHPPDQVETVATVRLEKGSDGFAITGITLDCTVKVAGITGKELQAVAEAARTGCPVSKALKAVPITLTLKQAA